MSENSMRGVAATTDSWRIAIDALVSSALLPGLTADHYAAVGDELTVRSVGAGERLIAEGEVARRLFVVMSGELEVTIDSGRGDQRLVRLGRGEVIGEIGLLAGQSRSASVTAVTDCEVVSLTAAGFDQLLAEHPHEADGLAKRAAERLRETQLVAHFNAIFGVIEPEVLDAIAAAMEWVSVRAGTLLFAAGDVGDAAYLVASGRLGVYRRDEDSRVEREIGQVGRGDIVGEIALLDGEPRTASVYAVRDTQLIRFSREAYDHLLDLHPRVGLLIARVALARQRVGPSRPSERKHSFAFVPVTGGVDLAAFARQFVGALGSGARTVDSGDIDAMVGRPGGSQIGDDDVGSLRLAYTLDELEEHHESLVYLPDDTWTRWSRRALRWSDHVVLVADATADPAQSPLESELWSLVAKQRHPDVSLVLLHPPDTDLPTGTPSWLAHRNVVSHHHVRKGDAAHLARTARLLSGRGVSVVLGGGGAKGFAHLGVLQVLEELGVPVDMVGGTSIGSVMAASAAMELPATERRKRATSAFDDLMDYTVPTAAILRGAKITASLESNFGGIDITDLWVPYYCVAANLTAGTASYLDSGPLVRAVRASIAIPGVLPPVPLDGDLLVDGAVLDNVPVEEMRNRNPTGAIIAVDVSPPDVRGTSEDYGLSVSGLAAFRARKRRNGPPSLMSTIVRATLVASAGARRRAMSEGTADLFLQVGVDASGLLDFSRAAKMVDSAADTTRPALTEWANRWNEGTDMPTVVTTSSPRAPVIAPDRRRRSGGTLLLTLRDFQFRASRFGSVILGIAVVLALLFLMTGLSEQFRREPRLTVQGFGAAAWMLPEGATGAFTSSAIMPTSAADLVEGVEASPVIIGRHTLTKEGGESVDIVIIGFRAGALGQPEIRKGSLPQSAGQLVADEASGLGEGDVAQIGAESFDVIGTTTGRTLFAGMPLMFLELAEAQALVYQGEDVANSVLLGGVPDELPAGFVALGPDAIATDAMRPLERSISSINLIRVLLWFVAALIIGTMTYLSALERRRDVAVLKAVGASTRQLGISMALQGALIALAAAVLASGLQIVMVPIFPLDVAVPASAFVQIPVIAVVVSLLAGLFGLRKAVGVDPALAFAGPGA